MKTPQLKNYGRTFFSAVLAFLIIIMLNACNRKIAFTNSTVVPGANGYVKVKKDKNNNYAIQISVINLADSKRLQPPKNTYVAWMVTNDNGTMNIGKLNSSSGFLSKTLKASLQTVSTFKPKRIFITAEDDATIRYPGSQVILSTESF